MAEAREKLGQGGGYACTGKALDNFIRAFSRDELLEKIWGYEYFGDTRTVDVHIRHLRAKLAAADASMLNAIGTVRGVGYRFELPAR